MKCKACKREIPINSIFCNWCGKRQVVEAGKVSVPNPRQLPSGSWRIYLAKEKASVTAPTEAECRTKAEAIRSGYIKADKKRTITLRKAYEQYIDSKKDILSVSTIAGYNRLIKNSFNDIMDKQLDTLTVPQIQRAVNDYSKEHSPKSVRNAYGLLTAVLSVYRQDFKPNATLPQKQKTQQRALNRAEIEAIIKAVKGDVIELPVLCGLWLGMRMSEIVGAEAEDIKECRLHICRAVVLDENGNAVEKSPKTFSGDRWVSIPPYIMELVPTEGRLTNLSGQAIYKRFSRICEANGIPHCRFHDLRHANASVMLSLGIDSATAQERNGWSSDRMYKQVYGYSQSETAEAADKAINDYFSTIVSTN